MLTVKTITLSHARANPHTTAAAAVLLLLSVTLLYSRLSFLIPQPQHPLYRSHDDSFNPLLDDPDSDALTATNPNEYRIDELEDAGLDEGSSSSSNNEVILADEEDEDAAQNQGSVGIFLVVRRSFNRRFIEEWEDYVPFNLKHSSELGFGTDKFKPVFGSDDFLVDDRLRTILSGVRKIEDALLLKESTLREGWGEWFEKKADFLRRDRMFKSNVEIFNP